MCRWQRRIYFWVKLKLLSNKSQLCDSSYTFRDSCRVFNFCHSLRVCFDKKFLMLTLIPYSLHAFHRINSQLDRNSMKLKKQQKQLVLNKSYKLPAFRLGLMPAASWMENIFSVYVSIKLKLSSRSSPSSASISLPFKVERSIPKVVAAFPFTLQLFHPPS